MTAQRAGANYIEHFVQEACDPLPRPTYNGIEAGHIDDRRAAWRRQIVGQLSDHDLRRMVETLASRHPREFEQELYWVGYLRRSADARS